MERMEFRIKTGDVLMLTPFPNRKFASQTREYSCFSAMHYRCGPKCERHKDYSGRGIRVCKRWSGTHGLRNFVRDMGPVPFPGATIERINNNRGYSKGNCRWAHRSEQARNTRRNRVVKFNGRIATLTEWSKAFGINRETIARRLNAGWSPEDALTVPVHQRHCSGYRWRVAHPRAKKFRCRGPVLPLDSGQTELASRSAQFDGGYVRVRQLKTQSSEGQHEQEDLRRVPRLLRLRGRRIAGEATVYSMPAASGL